MMKMKSVWQLMLVIPCGLAIGCGKASDLPKLADVRGYVSTASGKPLTGVNVRFEPIGVAEKASTATTDENGSFVLKYGPKTEGAVVGQHNVRVIVVGERGPSSPEGEPGPPLKPPKEINIGVMTVEEGGEEFKLQIPDLPNA